MALNNFYIDQLYLGTNRLATGDNLITGQTNIFPEFPGLNGNIGGYPFVIQLTALNTIAFDPTARIEIKTNYSNDNGASPPSQNSISNNFLLNTTSKPALPANESYYIYSNIAGLSGSKILPSDLTITDVANRTIELPFLLAGSAGFEVVFKRKLLLILFWDGGLAPLSLE